ncbi:MAG TPA: trypsin-like peptidase domain-containing protein [Pyrinomonadaceae bacterium]|jgi:S1-C subfamily serine protease|nr:trypsin-like peptidase domain-containing protein [Pyrinomonadaceae bacterium]
MASGLVVHVEVGDERHTEVLMHERIRIGSDADCELRFQPGAIPRADGFLLELQRTNGHYRVGDFDRSLRLTHNDAPLAPAVAIKDGDMVRIPDTDFVLQFFPVESPPALVAKRRSDVHVAPFIENAAIESAATTRRDDAKVFLREFTRELIREINLSTKIIALLIVVALVGGFLYFGFAGFKELKQSRRHIEEQNAQIARLNQKVGESQNQFEEVNRSNKDIINSLSLAPKIRSEYGNGVCLISGMYIFVEAGTGRPLRYPQPQQPADAEGDGAETAEAAPSEMLTPEGTGAVAEFPYVGTGFHVGGGYVVTNRHVGVEPWVADERSMVLGSTVSGKPRLTKLLAYFPGHRQPFALKFRQASARDDLAVLYFDAGAQLGNIPALPIDDNSDAGGVGRAVVLMGYPSGPDRILVSLPDDEANNIKQRFGSSLDVLVGHLAERNLIKPLTTQGHVTDSQTRRIIYDARTAEGGSGAPLFGQSGRVIGINFGIFEGLQDANFAVPVRFAVPLLERAGWKPAAPPVENITTAATAGDASGKDARTPNAPSNQPR